MRPIACRQPGRVPIGFRVIYPARLSRHLLEKKRTPPSGLARVLSRPAARRRLRLYQLADERPALRVLHGPER